MAKTKSGNSLSYNVAVEADVSSFLSEIQTALKGWADIEKINDKEVKVKLTYDGNFSEYRNLIQKATNESPEVVVKFIYDMNKQALEAKKKELANFTTADLKITADGDNKAAFGELKKQLLAFFKEYNAIAKEQGGKTLRDIEFDDSDFEEQINKYSNRLETRAKAIGSLYNELQNLMPGNKFLSAIGDVTDSDAIDSIDPNQIASEIADIFGKQAKANGNLLYSNLVAQVKEAVDELSAEDKRLATIVGNINESMDNVGKTKSSTASKKKTSTATETAAENGTPSSGGTGSGEGNGTGIVNGTALQNPTIVEIKADTTDFDAKFADVKEKIDSIPNDKTVTIHIDSNTAENDISLLQKQLGGIEESPIVKAVQTDENVDTQTVKLNVTSDDLSELTTVYNNAMDMVSKLNQEKAIVSIMGDAVDFFVTASTVERTIKELSEPNEIEIKSDAKDTVSALKKIEKVQRNVDTGSPINVPIVLGSVSQFKKELKEFGKTQSVKIEITPQLSKQALKEIASQIEAKIGKPAKGVNTKDATYQKSQQALYKAQAEAEKENEAFKEYKALTGKSLNPDNGSFVKQLKAFKSEQEKAQKRIKAQIDKLHAEALKENEAFKTYKELYGESPSNNGTSYVDQLAAKKSKVRLAEKALKSSKDYQVRAALDKSTNKLNNKSQSNLTDAAIAKINTLKKRIAELNAKPIELGSEEQQAEVEALNKDVIELLSELSKADSKKGNLIKLGSLQEELSKTIGKYSGMTPELRSQYTALLGNITDAMSAGYDVSAGKVQEFVLKAKSLNSELKITGQDTTSFLGTVSERLKGVNAQFIAQYLSLQDLIRYIKVAADTVIQLDSALTELRKVSDASTERLTQSFKKSAETAKELGATVSDVINITADWSRLGYSVDESEELAKATTLFKNVGDNMTADDASSYMISTLQGFQLKASDAIDIIDKYNEVANNFAISTDGIGAALQRSAASFSAANTDLSEAIAIITAANGVVQDPEKIGNAFKTISARIRGATNELTELGEEESEVMSTAKMQTYIKGLTGVDILEDDGKTFKSLYDILLGISKVWDNLTDLEQAGLAEKLAGKNQANVMLALLQNSEQLEAAYNTAVNSSGSAMKEQENYSRSIQHSIDTAKASMQELASTTLATDDVKNAVDLFNQLVQAVNSLVDAMGVAIPLGTSLATVFGISSASTSGKFGTGVKEFFAGIGDVGNVEGLAAKVETAKQKVVEAEKALEKTKKKKYTKAEEKATPRADDIKKNTEALKQANQTLEETEKRSSNASTALKALKNIGMSLAIETATAAVYSLLTAESRLENQAKDAAQNYQNQVKVFDDLTDKIKEQYAVLNDSNATYTQQTEARQALYDIQGQLISTYGEEANGVQLLTEKYGDLESALNSLEELKASQLNNALEQIASINSSGILDGIIDKLVNAAHGVGSNAERIADEYNNYEAQLTTKLYSNKFWGYDKDKVDEYNSRVDSILKANNVSTDTLSGNIVGDVEDVKEALTEIQKVANQLGFTDISKSITSELADATSKISANKDFVNGLTYYNEINGNDKVSGIVDDYTAIAERYESAKVSNDEAELEKVKQDLLSLANSEDFETLSDNVKRYIASICPQLQAEFEKWEFELHFKEDLNDIYEHAKSFSNTDELRNALDGKMSQSEMTDAQKADVNYYNSLGASTDEIISNIEANNILPTKTAQDFDEKIKTLKGDTAELKTLITDFGDEEKSAFLDATKYCNDAESAVKAYNKTLQATSKSFTAGEMATKLANLDSGFKTLQTLYNDVQDAGQFDYSSLVDAAENLSIEDNSGLKGTTEQFNALKDAIANAPDDISKCKSAFNDLVSAYIKNKLGAENLTKENEAVIASYLEQQGVANATAVAHRLVTDSLLEQNDAGKNAANQTAYVASTMNIAAKAAELEAQGLDSDAQAYITYALKKAAANITLYTADQISQLVSEAQTCGIAAGAWVDYWNAKNGAISSASGASYANSDEQDTTGRAAAKIAEMNAKTQQKRVEKQLQDLTSNLSPNYTAPPSSSGGGGSDSSNDKGTDIEQAWDERAIAKAEKAYQEYLDTRDDESKSYSERLGTYEEANRKQWKESYETYVKYAMQYRNAANGNLDITEYTPTWSAEDGRYKTDLGELTSVVSNGDKIFTVQIATKLSDGTELTPEQAQEYLKSLSTNSSEDLLKSDTKNILIRYTEGNDPNAFIYEQGQDLVKNLQYLRDLSYGTYKEQKDEVDSLGEALDALIAKLKEQKALYEQVFEQDVQKVKDLFGEQQAAAFVELVKNGSTDLADWQTIIKGASDEQKEALERLISDYDKIDEIQDSIKDKEKEAHENRMKQFEMELDELEAIQSMYEAQQNIYESQISLKEATGKLITTADYVKLLDNSEKITASYEKQLSVLKEQLGEVEPMSTEYYNVQSKILDVENELIQVKEQQAEWNEEIKNIPINLLDQYLERLKAIQNLVSDYMSLQTTYGKANTADEYSEIFKIANDNIDYALEQQKKLKEKLAKYEWGSDKYNETASSIESINSDLSSILEQMVEWNKAILNIPLDKLNEVNEQLNLVISAMTDIESEYDQVITAVTDSISKQIDDIEKEQEAYDDSIQDRIDSIQELIDALERENEARQKLLDVEDAEYELEKARTQKSIATIQNGRLTYTADEDSIKEQQQALDEAEYNYRIYQLQQQIEQLEKEKEDKDEAYQDEIDKLQDIADKWSEITTNIELAKNQLKATNYLGDGWLNKVLTGNDTDIYTQFKTMYESMDKSLTQYQEQVASNERIATLMEQFITQYENGSITYEKALSGLNNLVSSLSSGLDVNKTLDAYKDLFGGSSTTSLATVLSQLQGSAQAEADNLSKYMSLYKSNEEVISKYTSTWEDLKKSVDEQIKALKAAYEAALAAATAMRYYSSSSSSGGGGGGGSEYTTNITIAGRDYEVNGSTGQATYFNGSSAGNWSVSGGRYTGSSSSSSSSGTSHVIDSSGSYIRHDGIELGAVEATTDDRKVAILKAMSLKPMKADEVPQLLKRGEVVLNTEQQSRLLRNMSALTNAPSALSQGTNVVLNMSNLTFNEINNGQDFANFITKNLSNAVSQAMAK